MKFDESLKRKQYVSPEMKIKMISFADIIVTSVSNTTEDPVFIEDIDPNVIPGGSGDNDNPFGD